MSESLFESLPRNGRIITFYSFKGGVGRTMALANVAFLAAMQGRRVLMMDWDLEAPGLGYYFRGQLDAPEARALKEAPGILDIVCEWSQALKPPNKIDAQQLLRRFESGIPFDNCVHSVIASHALPRGACLDLIGAGGRVIKTFGDKSYEEALTEFSWPRFLNDEAGGVVLDALRQWAKREYDFIFLDSRTGMADVAGICTMQLPDVVALCFILNRQNMDGVAKIAGAVRAERSEQVQVRAAPMRVARSDTTEEADARARATAELIRVGGFSADAVREDFATLAVAQSESVPFYETLAPFVATDPKLDLLTLNYARLGSALIGEALEVPEIDSALVQLVRRRLQPRHATLEYVSKLRTMQPERAAGELSVLIDSAFEAALNGESLDDDYVFALVEVVISIPELSHASLDVGDLQSRTLDLLRELAQRDALKWRPALIGAAQRYFDVYEFTIDSEEQLLLLEELDGLLADSSTIATKLRRIHYRRRTVAAYQASGNSESALQTLEEVRTLIKNIPTSPPLAQDQMNQLVFADIDTNLVEADILLDQKEYHKALTIYLTQLERLTRQTFDLEEEKNEAAGFLFHLHSAIASARFPSEMVSLEERADHALAAAQTGRVSAVMRFNQLALAVATGKASAQKQLAFLVATIGFAEFRSKRLYSNVFGRQLRTADAFVQSITSLVRGTQELPATHREAVLEAIAETMTALLSNLRRRRIVGQTPMFDKFVAGIDELIETLHAGGLARDQLVPLITSYQAFFEGLRNTGPSSS
ncbi:AAA family ATPase [Variovorax sp. J22G73]|uniref:KGGVGR-motif variant AAA ATPase n=1 Tax=unclassified Variovorax TaxID=663243 RepID=UPI002577043F|nr:MULTISPECIES: AAA family ATPase [unclassified Variovorax]MDM0007480.1 AAA family ATPase [Variovorax sp. J22R203]MDM0100160.1 AAA family ATPase [Variovorax sp. J22G73]